MLYKNVERITCELDSLIERFLLAIYHKEKHGSERLYIDVRAVKPFIEKATEVCLLGDTLLNLYEKDDSK